MSSDPLGVLGHAIAIKALMTKILKLPILCNDHISVVFPPEIVKRNMPPSPSQKQQQMAMYPAKI